jgi:lipopolysaccharide export system protein LptA
VENSPYKSIWKHFLFSLAVIFLFNLMCVSFTVAAEKEKKTSSKNDQKNKQIHIVADKLKANNEAKYAEFIGNVKVTQDDTTITSDRLKIYSKRGLVGNQKRGSSEESIEKIVASGNVKIQFDNRTAMAENAVYTVKNRVLVLSGGNARIVSGKNTLTGSKITYYRGDGRINVDGRIHAVFFSKGKGLK